jgi:hypothetical protein
MFCPSCRSEYRDGFTRCEGCSVELVDVLPPEPSAEYREFQEILSTFNPIDVALIRSMLDGTGIEYYFNGEFFNNIEQMVQPARLRVRKDQAAEACEVLKDFSVKFMVPSRPDETPGEE